ncbi:MAG: hypothetical protein JNN04_12200 [Cyclobacteriaceae bacterium]|nr:hypothetical protein [Cyclobacteriaceae bacterium]
MAGRDTAFRNLGYYILLYLPLAAVAFHTTYFSVIEGQTPVTHVHFVVMALWLGLSITQPLLIRYRQTGWHRTIGKFSYIVLPMVVLTGFAMLRQGAKYEVARLQGEVASGAAALSDDQVVQRVLDGSLLGVVYIVWPAIFFTLAMWHRRNMIFHSRYMLAAIVTVTGPIVDRLFFIRLGIENIYSIPASFVAFTLIDGILAALAWVDYRNGRPVKPLVVSLIIYLALQLAYLILPGTPAWRAVASFLLPI